MTTDIEKFAAQLEAELRQDILPFWMEQMTDRRNGGYYGRITGRGRLEPQAAKGAILNARILWTFSTAFRLFGCSEYREAATRARNYLAEHFYDREEGGIYWSVDWQGRPLDTKKQFYAIAFAIYGLSEYFRATGDRQALDDAIALYRTIEAHSYDALNNGYLEAAARDWTALADMRLSDKDENESKTMNTHLHILEGYMGLYRVWPDEQLGRRLRNLIEIFLSRIVNGGTGHLDLFFDDRWTRHGDIRSYGHDIEASWLLYEAAEALGDQALKDRLLPVIVKIASAADEGLQPDNSMIYERDMLTGRTDRQRQWWVEAECVVGHFNLWRLTSDERQLGKALATWQYISDYMIDREHGEWFWSTGDDGRPDLDEDKAGFWKCPYHNGRMCMQIVEWTRNKA